MLANLTIEKNDFSRASRLGGHVNPFLAGLSKEKFISGGGQRKVRRHVTDGDSCLRVIVPLWETKNLKSHERSGPGR